MSKDELAMSAEGPADALVEALSAVFNPLVERLERIEAALGIDVEPAEQPTAGGDGDVG